MAPMLATANDILDWLGVGSIPIIGGVIDFGTGAVTSAFLFTLEGHPRWKAQIIIWAATFFEMIPLGVNELIPTNMIGVALALFITLRAAHKAQDRLEHIGKGVTGN